MMPDDKISTTLEKIQNDIKRKRRDFEEKERDEEDAEFRAAVALSLESTTTLWDEYRNSTTVAGLRNLSTSCYLNAVVQVLYFWSTFRVRIMQDRDDQKLGLANKDQEVSKKARDALSDLFVNMFSQPQPVLDSSEWFKFLQHHSQSRDYRSGVQLDARDALLEIMQLLGTSFFQNGEVKPVLYTFRMCQTHSRTMGKVTDIDSDSVMNLYCAKDTDIKSASLLYFLKQNAAIETTIGDTFCQECKAPSLTLNEAGVTQWPNRLFLCLNKFVFDVGRNGYHKQDVEVDIPLRIASDQLLKKWGLEQARPPTSQDLDRWAYDLRAIIVHAGPSPTAGHYYSYVKKEDGSWILCNDAMVKELGMTLAEPIVRDIAKHAYIVSYERVSLPGYIRCTNPKCGREISDTNQHCRYCHRRSPLRHESFCTKCRRCRPGRPSKIKVDDQ